MVSVTLRLRAVPQAALALFACVLLIAGCSGASTQQSQTPPPAPLAVSTTSLPNGEVNTAYSATLAATGGTAPYSWSLAAGTLPAGMTFDTAGGALGGTPGAPVSGAALTFQVSDSSSPAQTSQAQLSLTVVPALAVTTTSLPNGQVGAAYSATLAATGGTAPYSWALTAGTLPAGMTFDTASGALGGTPTAAATATSLTFTVTDSGAHAHSVGATLALTVGTTTPPAAPTVTTTTLPNGIVGHAYTATLAASGGTAPYTWTLTAGAMPAGLQLSGTGTIAGTPTAAAAGTVTVTVTDAHGQTGSATLSLTVVAALTVTTTSLPSAVVGKPYAATLAASGGVAPYSWTSSALPAGLLLNAATGALSGTPTAAGAVTPTFTVTDSGTQSAGKNLTLTVAAVLSITTTTLPNGLVNKAYTTTLVASGGVAPYTWSLPGNSLPAGLVLNTASGVISGTPTQSVSALSLSVRVTDAGGVQTANATLTLTVAATLSITTTTLPTGTTGKTYLATLAAVGGVLPYSWSLTGGTLPTGMALNARTGGLSGVPTVTASNVQLTFTVTDNNQVQSANVTLSLTVIAGLSITTTSLPNGQIGVAYSTTLAATGGTTPYTWTLAQGSALPAGLVLAPGGAISGTPTATASGAMVTFTVTDSGTPQPQSANVTLLITVSPAGIAVSIAPGRAGLTVTQTLPVSATTNDNAGVTWSISPSGGSFSPAASLSGASVTFTAPASPGVYTVTATSVTDTTRSAAITIGVTDLAGVYTSHNNPGRDGVNSQEYALTRTLVTSGTFGKLFSCTVDGAVYAQPLWMANQTITGGRHNVVFVATEHDSLYALDADTSPCVQLWHVSLIDSAHGAAAGETSVPAGTAASGGFKVGMGLGNLQPEAGVSGTPVIDPATNILYVVSKSMNAAGTSFFQRLHAIDLFTGNEKAGSPVTITATFPGTFAGGGPNVLFNPQPENQRTGLALANGSVYIAWGSHEDAYPWVGWVIGYAYAGGQFTQTGAFLAAPNTGKAGVWMGGGAPSVDDAGNIYVITGNGQFDVGNPTAPNNDYGDSFLQLGPTLGVNSYFTPTDQDTDNTGDKDFGSGGSSVVLNNPTGAIKHLVIGGGKDGALYVLNGDNMGGLGDGFAHQMFTVGSGIFDTPAFFNNTMYIAPIGGTLFAFPFNPASNTFTSTFSSRSTATFKFPGATPSVSASGVSNGLVWALDNSQYCTGQSPGCGPAVLHALDASNLGTEAWNSAQASTDAAGNAVKYTVPTIANGKVYIGTRGNNTGGVFGSTSASGELDVYGLKP